MGLDMYLYAEKYLWRDDEQAKQVAALFPELGDKPVKGVKSEVMYWRKANMIHHWFVQECQGGKDECQTTEIDREKLQELLDLCKRVQADPSLAPTLLPCASGFFFGATEYGEYYMEDIEATITGLESILSNNNLKEWDFSYRASW
jgi:hypothetical protein